MEVTCNEYIQIGHGSTSHLHNHVSIYPSLSRILICITERCLLWVFGIDLHAEFVFHFSCLSLIEHIKNAENVSGRI